MFKASFLPAILALNRMSFLVKFIVIGLLLFLPFAYVTRLMVQGSQRQIEFNQKEVFGVDYIAPALRLLGRVQDFRTLAASRAEGADLELEKREIDSLLPDIDAVDAKYRDAFRTGDGIDACSRKWSEIRSRWTELRTHPVRTTEEGFEANTALCKLIALWILNDVANYSNLILDPDLDSYWLMDAHVSKLPQLSETMSEACARSLLISSSKQELKLQDRLKIGGLHTDARNGLEALIDVNLATAYAFNRTKQGGLRAQIDATAMAARTACRNFLKSVYEGVIVREGAGAGPIELTRSAQTALESTRKLNEQIGPELRSLILLRVDAYRKDRMQGIIAAVGATLLYIYLFIAFFLSLHDSVQRIATFTRRMIQGTKEHFQLDGRDELARIADSYNEINAALNETRRLKDALQSSEERFRSLADKAPVGIFRTDAVGKCLYANAHASRLAGLSPGDVLGDGWATALHPDERARILQEWDAAVATGSPFSSEYRLGKSWVSGNAVALRDETGALTGFLGSVTDITERKRLEKQKDEFITAVSHELRTPLTSMRGSLGLVVSGAIGPLPSQARVMIEVAARNCDRLVALVNDILDIDKATSGTMALKMKDIEMVSLMRQTAELLRPFADSMGVTLSLDMPEPGVAVCADMDRLIQVVSNLISNACKFSPRGETVTLRLRKEEGLVWVEVEDRGPGIPDEFRPRIFQKFAQAASTDNSQRKGTGLGLAISKVLTESMGGTIGFTTRVGSGSTFNVSLPERKPAPNSQAG